MSASTGHTDRFVPTCGFVVMLDALIAQESRMELEEDPPLGANFDEWLDRRRSQLRPTALRCYRNTADRYLRPRLGGVRMCDAR